MSGVDTPSGERHAARPAGTNLRLEYRFQLDEVEVPCFSVEAIEGIGKLFTLAPSS